MLLPLAFVSACLVCTPLPGALQPPQPEAPSRTDKPQLADPLTAFASLSPKVVTDSLQFAEGPLWLDGKLLVCDLSADAVYTIAPAADDPATTAVESWGTPKEFRKPSGRAAGSAVDAQGRLLLATFTGTVTRTEKDATVSTIAQECVLDGKATPLARCNDLAVHPDGSIFFTDFGKQKSPSKGLFCISPAGAVQRLDPDFAGANGVALSPDSKKLYVNDYGKNTVVEFDVGANGAVSNRRLLVDLSTEKSPGRCDGIKVHPDGRVFTTGPGGIWVISPQGKPLTRLDIDGGASNLCFGGKDGTTLFITAGNQVLSVDLASAPDPARQSPPEKK